VWAVLARVRASAEYQRNCSLGNSDPAAAEADPASTLSNAALKRCATHLKFRVSHERGSGLGISPPCRSKSRSDKGGAPRLMSDFKQRRM